MNTKYSNELFHFCHNFIRPYHFVSFCQQKKHEGTMLCRFIFRLEYNLEELVANLALHFDSQLMATTLMFVVKQEDTNISHKMH